LIQPSNILPFFVVLSLAGAFLIALLGRRSKILPDAVGIAVTFAALLLSVSALPLAGALKSRIYNMGGWPAPVGITLVFDGLTAFMLVTVNLIAFFVALYSVSYMRRYTSKWKFYALFLLMLAGMNGVIITGDIFNLFVFLEIASVASYALVAFGTEAEELEASFKYAIMGSIASAFIFIGIRFRIIILRMKDTICIAYIYAKFKIQTNAYIRQACIYY